MPGMRQATPAPFAAAQRGDMAIADIRQPHVVSRARRASRRIRTTSPRGIASISTTCSTVKELGMPPAEGAMTGALDRRPRSAVVQDDCHCRPRPRDQSRTVHRRHCNPSAISSPGRLEATPSTTATGPTCECQRRTTLSRNLDSCGRGPACWPLRRREAARPTIAHHG